MDSKQNVVKKSQINRSYSLEDLPSTNANGRNEFFGDQNTMSLFHDDTVTDLRNSRFRANGDLKIQTKDNDVESKPLLNLDQTLREKLRKMESMLDHSIKRDNSSSLLNQQVRSRVVLENNVTSKNENNELTEDEPYNEFEFLNSSNFDSLTEDSNAAKMLMEAEEDEEFTNVDEIDGPISSPLLEVSTSNDNNFKNPNTIDYNISVDEHLQKSLDEKAAEIDQGLQDIVHLSTPKLNWTLEDCFSLEKEISQWFSTSDFHNLDIAQKLFAKYCDSDDKFSDDINYAKEVIANILSDIELEKPGSIFALAFVAMSLASNKQTIASQITYLKRNVSLVLDSGIEIVVNSFIKTANSCKNDTENLNEKTIALFHSSTVMYFVICVCLDYRKCPDKILQVDVSNTIQVFHQKKVLQFVTKYIEHWRWNSRLAMRIRSMITLLHKLLLLQFGDNITFSKTRLELYKYHNLDVSVKNECSSLKISPTKYEAFKEDIMARYPEFEPLEGDLPKEYDNSNSLSQFLEIPRSKSRNPINHTLPVPERHLATPVPSPPDSPTLLPTAFTTRIRKSFQTNMAYPCLYPSDNENDQDELSERIKLHNFENNLNPNSKNQALPYSIVEATNIIKNSIHISLANEQLWYEKDKFMMAERGWSGPNEKSPFDYLHIDNEENIEALNIMKRIEQFYEDCLPSFNSLIFVLLQTMESNFSNIDIVSRHMDLGSEQTSDAPGLELVRAKEIVLRSLSGIIYSLLKWFKLCHILKFEHLCVLLYDSHYVNVSTALLGRYSELYLDKIFNKLSTTPTSFWTESTKYCKKLSYNITASREPQDTTILTSFAYILRILQKVTGDKTQRLKDLPLSIGTLFKRYFRVYCMDIYHPILEMVRELTPFKNKRWKSEHMELISGVFLYQRLELTDNWVTGKDISNELSDACGQEIALRALLQYYNYVHHKRALTDLGYDTRFNPHESYLNRQAESLPF